MNLLVVEDDENKRQHLIKCLNEKFPKLSIIERSSYQSGLKEILRGYCDVVVLDMTLPTFDKSSVESGGLLKHFGGREILGQMDRRNVKIPVIVFTAFDQFGEGASKKSLAELEEELGSAYPALYQGAVSYDAALNDWKVQLTRLLTAVLVGLERNKNA